MAKEQTEEILFFPMEKMGIPDLENPNRLFLFADFIREHLWEDAEMTGKTRVGCPFCEKGHLKMAGDKEPLYPYRGAFVPFDKLPPLRRPTAGIAFGAVYNFACSSPKSRCRATFTGTLQWGRVD